MKEQSIQEKIAAILGNSRWTQEELARRLGVPLKTLNSWATGKAQPRAVNLAAVDDFYDLIAGRKVVSQDLLEKTERHALNAKIELDELVENEDLLRAATLLLTYHTNSIEGSTMTMEDVGLVLDDEGVTIPDKTVREQVEVVNHRAALNFILKELRERGEDFVWTSEFIRQIHQRLMNGIMESAGFFRMHRVRIIGSPVALADWRSVPEEVEELVKFLNEPSEDMIAKIAETHALFEKIHPFGDGNGRTGRLIMLAQALNYGIVPPLVLQERKKAYYKCLEKAQMEDDLEFLRQFVAESILAADELLR